MRNKGKEHAPSANGRPLLLGSGVVRLLALCIAVMGMRAGVARANANSTDVVGAYISSWTRVVPDPTLMTHVFYAFGHVSETFDGVRVDNPGRLRDIVALKRQNPRLKVLLSVGGWGSGRFSEMAASAANRAAFAKDCRRVVSEFALDGIDIDWEYPTQGSAGISSSPDDTGNFTLLMRDLRKALGKRLLLTCATVASGEYVDFAACIEYLDFVNVMAYDMGNPPRHHSALYPSGISGWMTGAQAVEAHLRKGVPASKLVMGVPFYGRGDRKYARWAKNQGLGNDGGVRRKWSEASKVPYLANDGDTLVFGYEDTRSLAIKCQYVIDKKLRGAMYWEYADDNTQLDFARTVALSIMRNQRGTMAPKRILAVAEQGTPHQGFCDAAKAWLDEHAMSDFNAEVTYVADLTHMEKGEMGKYHLVLMLNYPPFSAPVAWSHDAAADFERYIDRGDGAFVGFHHASLLGDIFGAGKMWQWFSDFMGGIRWKGYVPELADGTICVEDKEHPVMRGVADTVRIPKDEWYTYDRSPRPNVRVLAHADEASYSPASGVRMGDHPVVWVNEGKAARNVYFQIGHSEELFSTPGFVRMFANAIGWALGVAP